MTESLIYFTDRSPFDSDPYSYWVWKEFEERARSGFEVYVYLFNLPESRTPRDLPSRIHLRTALQRNSFLSLRPFIQSLLTTPAASFCLIEPLSPATRSLWPLLFIPQLRQLGMISAELSYLAFSASSHWIRNSCDVVRFSHPLYELKGISPKIRLEEIKMDPKIFLNHPHWSTEKASRSGLIPGSLQDLTRPKEFLKAAMEMVTRNTELQFVFLKGFGPSPEEKRKEFLEHPLAAHFTFPEEMTGAQIGQALFSASQLLVDWVEPSSSLAGLARKLDLERRQRTLKEKKVYELL